jgi:predicted DNA-binding transcriptional regulator AlpA
VAQFEPILATVREAARMLGVCNTTIYKLLKTDDTFPRPIYFGRSPRFLVSSLRDWVHAKQCAQLEIGRASKAAKEQEVW